VPAHRPRVAGGDGGHAAEVVAVPEAARIGAGHALPGAAVPVLDQGLVAGSVKVLAHGPRVAGGGGGHRGELAAVVGVRAGDLSPRLAVPVRDQGLAEAATGGVGV